MMTTLRSRLGFILVIGLFATTAARYAFLKPFQANTDEGHGWALSQGQSTGNLIVYGARDQGSSSPLFYLSTKVVHAIQAAPFSSISFPFLARLTALLPLLLIVTWWAFRNASLTPGLRLMGIALFLFARPTLYYAAEARPYGLWLAESLLLLLWASARTSFGKWLGLSIAMGMTATASLFQLAAFALADFLSQPLRSSRDGRRDWKLGLVLLAGVLVSAYYGAHSDAYHFGELQRQYYFRQFVWSYRWPIAASVFLVWWERRHVPNERRQGLTIFCWFAISPLVYAATRYRAFFFTDRHYIYWTAALVCLILKLIVLFQEQRTQGARWVQQVGLGALIFACVWRLDLLGSAAQVLSLLKDGKSLW